MLFRTYVPGGRLFSLVRIRIKGDFGNSPYLGGGRIVLNVNEVVYDIVRAGAQGPKLNEVSYNKMVWWCPSGVFGAKLSTLAT